MTPGGENQAVSPSASRALGLGEDHGPFLRPGVREVAEHRIGRRDVAEDVDVRPDDLADELAADRRDVQPIDLSACRYLAQAGGRRGGSERVKLHRVLLAASQRRCRS